LVRTAALRSAADRERTLAAKCKDSSNPLEAKEAKILGKFRPHWATWNPRQMSGPLPDFVSRNAG
jgi:hypothetical protein